MTETTEPRPSKLAVAFAIGYDEKFAAERGVVIPGSYKNKPIDYIDPAPKPFIVQIPLVEYFEYVKRLRADKWQHNFCQRLQDACVERHNAKLWALIHAEAQLGKSSILAQVFPAWMLGHDPLHRFALATYNVTRSQTHAKVVIGILNLKIHKEIFPSKDGYVSPTASKEKWSTEARIQLNDGQDSYNPVGLQSGLTGSGFDTLVIDDPYANERDAFSDTIRLSLQNFWDFTVMSRMGDFSNVFGMFHRYHEQDLAGYLLDKGDFDYWRYATICDGPYLHTATGQKFEDPLNREIGEYISERRKPSYYTKNKANPRVWNSMFQGKPTSDEGDFFKIERIETLSGPRAAEEWGKCTTVTRAWDHAATDGAGDYTAGALIGMQADGTVIVNDMRLVQLDSAERVAYQQNVALEDGKSIPVCIPQEVGEAGKTLVFAMQQFLKGYTVVPRHVVTGTQSVTLGNNPKQRRAYNFSVAVNSGQVKFVEGKWNAEVIRAMKNFGFTTFDDPVDALGDGYNYLFETVQKGLVIKSFSPANLEQWSVFAETFGEKVPAKWLVYVGIKISADATLPNSAVIVTRAAENSGLKDHLFILDEYKEYTSSYENLFTWMRASLERLCEKPKAALVWLHPDSEHYKPTILQKSQQSVRIFHGQPEDGIAEANWYVQNEHLTVLLDPDRQFKDLQQEAATWGFNDKGIPDGRGQVWDCLRMVAHRFRTRASAMTFEERVDALLPEGTKEALQTAETGADKLSAQIAYEFQKEIVEQALMPVEEFEEEYY